MAKYCLLVSENFLKTYPNFRTYPIGDHQAKDHTLSSSSLGLYIPKLLLETKSSKVISGETALTVTQGM